MCLIVAYYRDDDQHGKQARQNEIRPIRLVVFSLRISTDRRPRIIPLINVPIVLGRLILHGVLPPIH